MWPIFYNYLLVPIVKLLLPFISAKNSKIRASLEGKSGLFSRLNNYLKNRDKNCRLVWFHAPSAGEFIQLQPLLEKCLNQGFECIITYNSVSAEKWIKNTKIVASRQPLFSDYLPLDFKENIRNWIHLVEPSVLVFIKYDLWPNVIWEAKKAKIPIFMVSATLHQKTKRYLSPIGRSFYRNIYSQFDGIFVVDENDKNRFLKTNPKLNNIRVFGDIRYDATIEQRTRKNPPKLPSAFEKNLVFVVGSSWPPDELCVFPGLKKALIEFPNLHLIIAPHEPIEEHLNNSELNFAQFKLIRLSQLELDSGYDEDIRIILVDSVGKLSALYAYGNLGYVGGGFTTGVHNVMEPCAMGLPVFFGPKHYNSGEALELSKKQLAFPVTNPEGFSEKLFQLLQDPNGIQTLGNNAQKYIESQSGATEKSFEAIAKVLKT